MGVCFVGRYPDGTYPSVQARNNWWGRNHLSFVAGRIWERRDDDNLIRVEYQPFLPDNTSVLHGRIVLINGIVLLLCHMHYVSIRHLLLATVCIDFDQSCYQRLICTNLSAEVQTVRPIYCGRLCSGCELF